LTKIYTDKNWLIDQYITKNKSVAKIAEENKVYKETIIKWLDIHGIYRNWKKAGNR
jgi:hypothetical protein